MKLPKSIVNFAFSVYTKKFNKTHKRDKRFVDFDHVKTVLLLFESSLSENHKIIQDIIKELISENKQVNAIGYVPKQKALTPSTFTFSILDKSQTNLWQRPDDSLLQNLIDEPYDLVIDLTLHQVVPTDYLLVSANAKCKAGKKKSDNNLTDLMIDLPQQPIIAENEIDLKFSEERLLFDQIIFYLKQITAK